MRERKTVGEDPRLSLPAPMTLDDPETFLDRWDAYLEYDPQTGDLLWRQMAMPDEDAQARAARKASKRTPYGGRAARLSIDGFQLTAANVVWLLHHRRWPIGKLVRKNRNNADDRIENLEEVTPSSVKYRWFERAKVARCGEGWQVYCHINGRQKHLGRFQYNAEAQLYAERWNQGLDYV